MQKRYDVKTAMQDLDLIGTELIRKAEQHLEVSNFFEVAKIYSLVRNEQYKIDSDARRLRLTGELNSEMYDVMSQSYMDIGKRLIRLSHDYSLGNKIITIYNAIRFGSQIKLTYLTEYLREDQNQKL